MLPLRLTRKFEGLNDEAQRHLEAQIDLLLAMPEHCRRDVTGRLHLVARDAAIAASRAALLATRAAEVASITNKVRAETTTFVTRSRHLLATLRAHARRMQPAAPVPRHLALVAQSGRR